MNWVVYIFGIIFLVLVFWVALKLAIAGVIAISVAAIWIIMVAVFLYLFWRLF